MHAVKNDIGNVYFVYGFGGTGKTFLWKTISAAIHSQGDIVLNVASSAIASLLLPGGRTTHLRFAIPISVNEASVCSVSVDSKLATLIRKEKLVIWDEAPIIHRHCFESLYRTLRDIMQLSCSTLIEEPFG